MELVYFVIKHIFLYKGQFQCFQDIFFKQYMQSSVSILDIFYLINFYVHKSNHAMQDYNDIIFIYIITNS